MTFSAAEHARFKALLLPGEDLQIVSDDYLGGADVHEIHFRIWPRQLAPVVPPDAPTPTVKSEPLVEDRLTAKTRDECLDILEDVLRARNR